MASISAFSRSRSSSVKPRRADHMRDRSPCSTAPEVSPILLPQLTGDELAAEHADGAGQGRRQRHDPVRRARHVVAAGRRDVAHRHDHRLTGLPDPADLPPDHVGGDRGAARRVDPQSTTPRTWSSAKAARSSVATVSLPAWEPTGPGRCGRSRSRRGPRPGRGAGGAGRAGAAVAAAATGRRTAARPPYPSAPAGRPAPRRDSRAGRPSEPPTPPPPSVDRSRPARAPGPPTESGRPR